MNIARKIADHGEWEEYHQRKMQEPMPDKWGFKSDGHGYMYDYHKQERLRLGREYNKADG